MQLEPDKPQSSIWFSSSSHRQSKSLPRTFWVNPNKVQTQGPMEWWGATLSSQSTIDALIKIAAVLGFVDDYNDEFLKPENRILDFATHLIQTSYSEFEHEHTQSLPMVYPVADGQGGLRLRWVKGSKEVRLVCSASSAENSYIYHQDENSYDVEYNIDTAKLTNWLKWLISA